MFHTNLYLKQTLWFCNRTFLFYDELLCSKYCKLAYDFNFIAKWDLFGIKMNWSSWTLQKLKNSLSGWKWLNWHNQPAISRNKKRLKISILKPTIRIKTKTYFDFITKSSLDRLQFQHNTWSYIQKFYHMTSLQRNLLLSVWLLGSEKV